MSVHKDQWVKTPKFTHYCVFVLIIDKGRFQKKWLDLSNVHLTPASQAALDKKIQKLHNFFYVFIIFIITKFGENFEDKIDVCFF